MFGTNRPRLQQTPPHPLRIWLAALAVLLIALLPAPEAPEQQRDLRLLVTVPAALVAQPNRELISRHEGVQIRPLPAADLPVAARPPVPKPPRIVQFGEADPILPGARAPPTARARAPPLS